MTPELLEELEQVLRDHQDWRKDQLEKLLDNYKEEGRTERYRHYLDLKTMDFEVRLKKAKIKITKK